MSRPGNWWYHNVTRVISAYPLLADLMRDAEAQNVIANYSGMPRSGTASRTTEESATRALGKRDYEAFDAVSRAIQSVKRWPDGDTVLCIVDLHYWQKVGSFDYIEAQLAKTASAVSSRSARRMNTAFVYVVARNLGYTKAKK